MRINSDYFLPLIRAKVLFRIFVVRVNVNVIVDFRIPVPVVRVNVNVILTSGSLPVVRVNVNVILNFRIPFQFQLPGSGLM